jgi:hypothetical protein
MRSFLLLLLAALVLDTRRCLSAPGHFPTHSQLEVNPAILTNKTIDKVDHLWSQLEQVHPVRQMEHRILLDAPTYIDIGPDPQKALPFATHTPTTVKVDHLHFPKQFIVGVTSAATTVEGAVKDDHRGPSIWDALAHLPLTSSSDMQYVQNARAGFDIGTNFRYMYPLDIARVKAMGVRHYGFSVSWSRVYPMGE